MWNDSLWGIKRVDRMEAAPTAKLADRTRLRPNTLTTGANIVYPGTSIAQLNTIYKNGSSLKIREGLINLPNVSWVVYQCVTKFPHVAGKFNVQLNR